jgi:hypothetical protein
MLMFLSGYPSDHGTVMSLEDDSPTGKWEFMSQATDGFYIRRYCLGSSHIESADLRPSGSFFHMIWS